jgi:hypothetical protein
MRGTWEPGIEKEVTEVKEKAVDKVPRAQYCSQVRNRSVWRVWVCDCMTHRSSWKIWLRETRPPSDVFWFVEAIKQFVTYPINPNCAITWALWGYELFYGICNDPCSSIFHHMLGPRYMLTLNDVPQLCEVVGASPCWGISGTLVICTVRMKRRFPAGWL